MKLGKREKKKACNIRDDTMKIQMNRMLINFLLAFVCQKNTQATLTAIWPYVDVRMHQESIIRTILSPNQLRPIISLFHEKICDGLETPPQSINEKRDNEEQNNK